MNRPRLLVSALFLVPVVLGGAAAADPAPARPLRVLFLGDRGHHLPADRAAEITPVLAGRGIEVVYTEKVADLNPASLAKFDALLLYANIDEVGPAPEKALLDYVAGGGGFVPVHCASYCFRNSPAYVKLVGAQFQRHGTGEFTAKIVAPEHPTMAGLETFRAWDETYVHTQHNPDRTVLEVRAEGDAEEPWTWARTHGKGRVFYTASGHDARVWQDPGFHDLLERGLRWAANTGPVFDGRRRVPEGLKAFEYGPARVPQYLPGGKRGRGAEANTMQKPLDPAESQKHLVAPAGFSLALFASEPDIAKPLCMAWDHRGRLWIAESTDYPNEKQPAGKGHDRIKICEDTDGDGKADKFTVFAETLSIPTSLAFANGGVVVHQAPDTLFLKDEDGDDKADTRKVLFTGWGAGDTHAGPSNLRWGFDNWLWGMVGYASFKGTVGGEPLEFHQGFYRFKPDGSTLEYLRATSNNTWGLGFSEEGLVFGSTANGCASVYLPIPNRDYESVRGWSPSVLAPIVATNQFFPITDKVRQVDWHGGFTAAAGHALYTARRYPPHYWNNTAFVAEPTGHLTATLTLERQGTDFVTYNGWNLVASNDEWTAPIMAEVGPDGNVWVIDWYNYIVQHNPTPEGFNTGKGNAYEIPLRDKTHGRIYRVVHGDDKQFVAPTLDPKDGPGLVAALKNDNMFWRMHAQRLLVERGRTDVVPQLLGLLHDRNIDALGLNVGAIHAVWTLQGLGAIEGAPEPARRRATMALTHPANGVRRAAFLAGWARQTPGLAVAALDDLDPHVRLAATLALAEAPANPEAGRGLVRVVASGAFDGDRWLPDAATSAAARNDRVFLDALAEFEFKRPASAATLTIAGRVAEHYARGAPVDTIGTLLAALGEGDGRVTEAIVGGLSRGWPKGRPAKLDQAAEKDLSRLFVALPAGSKGALASLAERLGSQGITKHTATIASALLATARDEQKPDADRLGAARQLIEFRRSDGDSARSVLALIGPKTDPKLAAGLIAAVGHSEAGATGPALVGALSALTPAARFEALRALLGRADWTAALLDAADQGSLALAALSLDQKQALAAHPDKKLAARAKKLLGQGGGLPDPDRQKVIDALASKVLDGGDPIKGKVVFTQQCAKCHTHTGEGGKVGPDLTGMAAHPRSELLIHILDPSRNVEGNFVQYTVATTDGRVLTGLLASETKTSVDLLDAEGKTHAIPRSEIEELAASKKSLMPEGFEKQVPVESIADLLAFLTQRGKYMPLDLRTVATVVSTKGMFYSEDAEVERLIFPDWGPKTFEGVPFQLVDPRGDRVPNVVMLFAPSGNIPPKMPKSVTLPCHTPAKAIHLLSGVSGWGATGPGTDPTVTLIVRLRYADGTIEDHPLKNGVEFADYIRPIDVPGSKLAFRLRGQQVRYLAVYPKRSTPIESIDLVKGPDNTAPVVMAVTVEVQE